MNDPKLDATKHKAVIETPDWTIFIQGVSSVEQGVKIARQLEQEGGDGDVT